MSDTNPVTNPTADDYLEAARMIRNLLLADSDWTQLPDAPVDAAAWAAYRQQLRDFTDGWTPGPVTEDDFPEPPDA